MAYPFSGILGICLKEWVSSQNPGREKWLFFFNKTNIRTMCIRFHFYRFSIFATFPFCKANYWMQSLCTFSDFLYCLFFSEGNLNTLITPWPQSLPLLSSLRWLEFKLELWACVALASHTESYQHQVITWNATLWSIGIGFLGGCQGLKIWRVTLLWGETWPIGSERQEAFEQKNSLPFLSAVDHSEVWFLLAALPDTPAVHLPCLYQAYCEMWPEQWHITSHCFASFLPHFHCFLTLTIFSLHFPSKEATC